MGRKKVVKGGEITWAEDRVQTFIPDQPYDVIVNSVNSFTDEQKTIYKNSISTGNFSSLKTFIINFNNNNDRKIKERFKNKIIDYTQLIEAKDYEKFKIFLRTLSFQTLENIRDIITDQTIKIIILEIIEEKDDTDKIKEQEAGKRKPLTSCTVAELKAKAKKRGIKVTGLKKAEIIAKLRRR